MIARFARSVASQFVMLRVVSGGKKFGVAVGVVAAIVLVVVLLPDQLVPVPPAYEPGKGAEYAQELAGVSQTTSLTLLMMGWIAVVTAGLCAIAGSVLGSKPADKGDSAFDTLKKQRGLAASSCAIALGALGWQLLDRSTAATNAASVATRALRLTAEGNKDADRQAYLMCVEAKSLWLEGRMSHERLQMLWDKFNSKSPTAPPTTPPDGG